MTLGPRVFGGKKYSFVGCVDSVIRRNAVISDLKRRGYMYRSVKEGTYRNPLYCIYKRKGK